MDDIRKKTVEDLTKELAQARKELHDTSFTLSAAQRDVKKHREVKKRIARLKTELRFRELHIA
jgi:ribosomal protein L29